MIDTLTIRKIATFDDTGIQVTDLKKINFIYGANGCGKTTITKVVADPTNVLYQHCTVGWKNGMPIKPLVYNKDFRERNFGKGAIDGVFTLGQATKEDIDAIEKMQIELAGLTKLGIDTKTTLDKLNTDKIAMEEEYKELLWLDIYKKYEVEFKEAYTGVMKKDAFKLRILDEYTNNKTTLKTYVELKTKSATVFGTKPALMASIQPLSFDRIIEIETNTIWAKKIIGKADIDLAALIQRLNMNDWVNAGRGFLQEDTTCPFCQQSTITAKFRANLESYFDASFAADIKQVTNLTAEYSRLELVLTKLLEQTETNEKKNPLSKLNVELFSAHTRAIIAQFISNRELLNNKIKEPSRAVALVPVKTELDIIQQLITDANIAIIAHNAIVANLTNEKADLIKGIWKFLSQDNKAKIDLWNTKSSDLQKGIDALIKKRAELQDKYRTLDSKIKEANKNVTSVQPSVDQINKTLQFFGFHNFSIVPSASAKNQYQVHREDGTVADHTLSEGEITFITFLYFLQLAKGSISRESITDDRILVVDDPISSLDSNVLFVVSTLLKEIIKAIRKGEGTIKQLILLTHNVYFHKEVSFDGRSPENGDTHYWMLRRNHNTSNLQAYGMKSPIQNSYGLLWSELKNRSGLSGLSIQNTMRRIIEHYFKILGKYVDDDLILHFDNQAEQQICRSLISWINDGSHTIPDDMYVEQNDVTIDKYFEVFERIFKQMGHPEHYNMMMGGS